MNQQLGKGTIAAVLFILIAGVMAAEYNAPCSTDSKCHSIYTTSYSCEEGHCMRKELDMGTMDLLGFLMITVISMIANAGGLGAGAVIIPVYIFIYSFSATDSIPLSKITIFAGALVNCLLGWKDRDPRFKNHFLINYSMASIIIPLLVGGTMFGVILSKFLPVFIIITGLICYLLLSVVKMYDRGIKEWKKENAIREKLLQKGMQKIIKELGINDSGIQEQPEVIPKPLPDVSEDSSEGGRTPAIKDTEEGNAQDNVLTTSTDEGKSELSQHRDEEVSSKKNTEEEEFVPTFLLIRKHYCSIGYMILALLTIFGTSLLRGGEGSPSLVGIPQCTGTSYLLLILCQFLLISISRSAYRHNKETLDEADIRDTGSVDLKQRHKFFLLSFATGIAAGSLGIGGGMILGPFMLAMGFEAQSSTALSGFIVLFTSSSTSFQFGIAGAIHARHASYYMFFSLLGSFMGYFILKRLIRKYNRPSLIVWVVFSILVIASIVLPAQMIYNTFENPKRAFTFGSFC